MLGPKTNTTTTTINPTTNDSPGKSSSGVTYDFCRRVMKDGKEQLERIGRVFIRHSGTGGVAFVKNADGTEDQYPIFVRKPKAGAPKQEAAAQAA